MHAESAIAVPVRDIRGIIFDLANPRVEDVDFPSMAARLARQNRLALRADVAMLQSLRLRPFAVQVAGAGSFTTVPYLGVGRGQECLQRLHTALVPVDPAPDWRYVPHVTLGHYARRLPLREAVDKLLALTQDLPVFEVRVLALARYETADIAGPLTLEGVFELETGRYVAAPGALWSEPL